jgi:hypothetical protein
MPSGPAFIRDVAGLNLSIAELINTLHHELLHDHLKTLALSTLSQPPFWSVLKKIFCVF